MEASARQTLIDAARRWYDAGYCVIPTHEDGSKRPFGRWKSYQHERMPWDTLHDLLANGPYTGIGVIPGAVSGNAELTELEGPGDVAHDALVKIQELAEQRGNTDLLNKLFATGTTISPSSGLHLHYKLADGTAGPNTKLAMRIGGKVIAETRGEGGFVVVAPTTGRNGHPDASAYRFLTGGPDTIPTITASERDDFHALLRDALNEAPDPTPEPEPEPPQKPHSPDTGLTPWDDYATRTTWSEILEPHGWSRVFTASDGRTHWTRPGKNPADGTSATTLEDGPLYVFSTSTTFPAEVGLSKQAAYAHLHHAGDLTAAARALAEKGFGDPINRLKAFTPDTTDDVAAFIHKHLNVIDWFDLWDRDDTEEWIAEPLIAARRGTVLYSAPKAGKSLLMLEIVAGVVNGRSVFGYPEQPPRHVLYVDFENDPIGDIRPRLQAMGYAPADLARLHYLTYPNIAALDTEQGSRELLAAADHFTAELVVIDTTSRAVQGEENSNDTWLAWYRHTGLKLKQRGIAYIRLDHTGKDASKGQRGGSAKSGDVDAVWKLKVATESRIDLECEASRFLISEKHLTLRRDTNPLRHVATTDTYTDKITELYEHMERAAVPKIADLTTRQMIDAMKSAGIAFDKNLVTTKFITTYAQRITAFHQIETPE